MNGTDFKWKVFIIYSCVKCTLSCCETLVLSLSLSHRESWLPLKGKLKIKVKKAKWKSDVHGSEAIKRERETINYEAGERETETGRYVYLIIGSLWFFCLLWYSACFFLLLHVSHSNGSMCEQRWTLGLNFMDLSHSSGT